MTRVIFFIRNQKKSDNILSYQFVSKNPKQKKKMSWILSKIINANNDDISPFYDGLKAIEKNRFPSRICW